MQVIKNMEQASKSTRNPDHIVEIPMYPINSVANKSNKMGTIDEQSREVDSEFY